MTDVSNIHRFNRQDEFEQEGEFYLQPSAFADFDSFCLPSGFSGSFFVNDDSMTPLDFGFDVDSEPGHEDPNFLSGDEGDEDEMNFVTDLYESRDALLPQDLAWEFDSEGVEDSGLELGFVFGNRPDAGIWVEGMDSGSDCEDFEVNPGIVINNYVDDDGDDNYDGIGAFNDFLVGENDGDEFEWEEVSERIQFDEREALGSVIDHIGEISISSNIEERETLNFLMNGIEEISIPSNISFLGEDSQLDEGEGRNIEWEVLLAVNDLESYFEFENAQDGNIDGSEVSRIHLSEDNILSMEYDALFGQIVENENALRGSPPAAKSVIENLPVVELTEEEVGEGSVEVVCAICKDDIAIREKVHRLPCCHLYHKDCILPWLVIRNTCPVCRYELPTDDADYESRRSERGSEEVSYSFELLP